jgi:hypothetical protein
MDNIILLIQLNGGELKNSYFENEHMTIWIVAICNFRKQIYIFFLSFFFLVSLGFELKTWQLLGRDSTA